MGPRAIPEEWVRDDKVVHYLIPKTFVDWLTPKFGETGIYSLLTMGTLALASKEYLVFHIETKIAIEFFVTWSLPTHKGSLLLRLYCSQHTKAHFYSDFTAPNTQR